MFNMILEEITPLEKVRHFHHEDTYVNLCSQVVCARAVELPTDLYNDLLHNILHSLSFFFPMQLHGAEVDDENATPENIR